MLRQVAEGVLIHESEFCQSNAVIVQGRSGVLLIDPGVHDHEMAALGGDIRELGQPVAAGFATHPHWDHLLWHAGLGAAPRYGTARCAATARGELSEAGWTARIAEWTPPDIVEQISWGLFGLQDRAYVHALRDAHGLSDPRVGPSAKDGWDWVAGMHARQLQLLAQRSKRDGTPG